MSVKQASTELLKQLKSPIENSGTRALVEVGIISFQLSHSFCRSIFSSFWHFCLPSLLIDISVNLPLSIFIIQKSPSNFFQLISRFSFFCVSNRIHFTSFSSSFYLFSGILKPSVNPYHFCFFPFEKPIACSSLFHVQVHNPRRICHQTLSILFCKFLLLYFPFTDWTHLTNTKTSKTQIPIMFNGTSIILFIFNTISDVTTAQLAHS